VSVDEIEPDEKKDRDDWSAETAPVFDASKKVDSSRFHIARQLGIGPFGSVYVAQDLKRGREVALKLLPGTRADRLERLEHEFQELSKLRHENLVSHYEFVSEGEQLYFSMESLRALNFFEYGRQSWGVDEARLREALSQLATGLSALHEAGKLHQNLKPSNVVVTAEKRVVLLDYALLDLEVRELGRDLTLGGSAEYLSPEQARGEPLTPASDWYSVGILLYQVLTGRLPFCGSWAELIEARRAELLPPRTVDPRVPEDLSEVCLSLLAHEPGRRSGGGELRVRGDARPRPPARADSLLFGRQAELEKLEGALNRVEAGEGVTVLVDGNSGVGKTALVEHFLARQSGPEAAIVLRGRCYEREQVPYQGIDSLMDDLCRLLRGGLDPVAAEGVLPRHVAALVRLFPDLERVPLVAKRSERDRSVEVDERETRRKAFGALRDLLARIADNRTLIVHIDDLQWGDLDTAGLLRDVLRPPDAPIMLLILAYRREDQERSPCLRVLVQEPIGTEVQVHLGPLSSDVAEALMQELLSSTHSSLDVTQLAHEAAGNPFLLYEVARFAALQKGSEGHSKALDVQAALRARVARLPLAALELLQTVAVAGHPITEEVARRAAAPVGSATEAWRLLVDERLVRTSGPLDARMVETFHDRVRETVMASITTPRARACHRGLAAALEEAGSADPEVLAGHHEAGENPEQALRFTVEAADQATKALAFERAARLLQRAVDFVEGDRQQRVELLCKLGEALGNDGRCVQSAKVYLDASKLADFEERIPLRRRAANQLLFAGKIDDGRELIRDDLRAQKVPVPKTAGRTLVSVLLLRARIRIFGLGFEPRESADIPAEARTFLDHLRTVAVVMSFVDVGLGAEIGARFLLRAQKVGDRHFFVLGLALLAGHSGVEAPFSRRTRYLFEQMTEQGRGFDDPAVKGTLTAVRGLCAYFAGSWRMAVQQLDRAEETLRDCQGVVCELWSTRAVGIWSRFFLGDWGEMTRRVLVGLGDARDRGNAYGMAGMCSPFGVAAWLGKDEPEEARRALREVTSTWSVEGFQIQHYWFLMAGSLVQLYEGDGPGAWAEICRRWKSAAASLTMRFPANRAQLLHMRGCCALAAAEASRTAGARRALLEQAVKAARRLGRVNLPYAAPLANLLKAGVAAQRGVTAETASRLQAAILELDVQQMPVYAAAARRRLARLRGENVADFLPGQEIADADAVTRMLLPGFNGC
jgi:eukaryotic-like serine/threonine-protein kinase